MTPRVEKANACTPSGTGRAACQCGRTPTSREVWVSKTSPNTVHFNRKEKRNMAMVGFEKLADLDRRIKEGEAKMRELWGAGNKPQSPEARLLQKTLKHVEKLKDERQQLRGLLMARGEPLEDPVAAVHEKYARMGDYNRRIELMKKMVAELGELIKLQAQIQALETRVGVTGGCVQVMDPVFQIVRSNYLHRLQYTKPMRKDDYERELAEAEALVARLRREAEELERAEQAVASI